MPVNVLNMGPGQFTIGETAALKSFSSQVRSLTLVPKVDQDDAIPVLSGESVAGDRTESFSLKGSMLQDFGAASSLTEWLYTNRGTTMPFVFVPSTAAGRKITGNLIVEAIEIGGDVKTKPASDFEFQLVGSPSFAALP